MALDAFFGAAVGDVRLFSDGLFSAQVCLAAVLQQRLM
jgi:hypothetical protein